MIWLVLLSNRECRHEFGAECDSEIRKEHDEVIDTPFFTAYRWRYDIDGASQDFSVSPRWFINSSECCADAKENYPSFDTWDGHGSSKVTLHMMERVELAPDSVEFIAALVIYLLKEEVNLTAKQDCYGCNEEIKCMASQSQIDHMSGGCLSDMRDKIDLHFENAMCSLRNYDWRRLIGQYYSMFGWVNQLNIDIMSKVLAGKMLTMQHGEIFDETLYDALSHNEHIIGDVLSDIFDKVDSEINE